MSAETALARGNLKQFWSHSCNSHSPTQLCDLLCSGFLSVFNLLPPASPVPLLDADCSELFKISLLNPSFIIVLSRGVILLPRNIIVALILPYFLPSFIHKLDTNIRPGRPSLDASF